MGDVKDYTGSDSHYNGVDSMYGKNVDSQMKMQPNYCDPGEADGQMKGEKTNSQAGP